MQICDIIGATFSRMAMVLPNVGGVGPQVFRKCIRKVGSVLRQPFLREKPIS